MRKRLILMVYSCPVFQPKRKRLQQESGNEAEKDGSDTPPRMPSVQRKCGVPREKNGILYEECSLAQGDIICNVDTTKTGSVMCLAHHVDNITSKHPVIIQQITAKYPLFCDCCVST